MSSSRINYKFDIKGKMKQILDTQGENVKNKVEGGYHLGGKATRLGLII